MPYSVIESLKPLLKQLRPNSNNPWFDAKRDGSPCVLIIVSFRLISGWRVAAAISRNNATRAPTTLTRDPQSTPRPLTHPACTAPTCANVRDQLLPCTRLQHLRLRNLMRPPTLKPFCWNLFSPTLTGVCAAPARCACVSLLLLLAPAPTTPTFLPPHPCFLMCAPVPVHELPSSIGGCLGWGPRPNIARGGRSGREPTLGSASSRL